MSQAAERNVNLAILRIRSIHLLVLVPLCWCAMSLQVHAIDIIIDYSYDTSQWFGAGNPDGAAAGASAKTSLEEAATFFSSILDDTFNAITVPATFQSSFFGGVVSWNYERSFRDPTTDELVTITNVAVPENEYIIFAGARDLPAPRIGFGGPGGVSIGSNSNGLGFSAAEFDQATAIESAFFSNVVNRGETGGFANWGGSLTFDNNTNWHYESSTLPSTGENDFFSVALHELAHTLGFGTSAVWNDFVSNGVFTGTAATAEHGANVPATVGHWDLGLTSTVYGGTASQSPAMGPGLVLGSRQLFTDLDAAGMTDIGWTVVPLPVVTLACDFDGDQDCDPNDLDLMYANFGTTIAMYDSNGDGTVDDLDIATWLAQASSSNNPFNINGKTFVIGDVNFDGAVTSTDLGILLNNFADTSGLLYETGNLNDDMVVDSTDLGLLLNNFGSTSSIAVPEPAGQTVFIVWLVAAVIGRCRIGLANAKSSV